MHEYGIQIKNRFVDLLKIQRDHIKNIDALWDGFYSFFHVPENTDNLCFKTIAELNAAKVKARVLYYYIFKDFKNVHRNKITLSYL